MHVVQAHGPVGDRPAVTYMYVTYMHVLKTPQQPEVRPTKDFITGMV